MIFIIDISDFFLFGFLIITFLCIWEHVLAKVIPSWAMNLSKSFPWMTSFVPCLLSACVCLHVSMVLKLTDTCSIANTVSYLRDLIGYRPNDISTMLCQYFHDISDITETTSGTVVFYIINDGWYWSWFRDFKNWVLGTNLSCLNWLVDWCHMPAIMIIFFIYNILGEYWLLFFIKWSSLLSN